MKIFLLIFISCLAFGCKNKSNSALDHYKKVLSETDKFLDSMKAAKAADSMTQSFTRNILYDTVGVDESPIKILKAYLYQKEYSSYKNISIVFKNISNKKVDGIRFSWYGENAFHEPADMGGYIQQGFGGGFTDKSVRPNQTMSLQWNILSRDGKKVHAWPTEVVFEDGSKWKSTYKSN